jgi:hypothetical protein
MKVEVGLMNLMSVLTSARLIAKSRGQDHLARTVWKMVASLNVVSGKLIYILKFSTEWWKIVKPSKFFPGEMQSSVKIAGIAVLCLYVRDKLIGV